MTFYQDIRKNIFKQLKMKTRIKPTLKNLKAIDKAIREYKVKKDIWNIVKDFKGTDYRITAIRK
jgi:hypothetical protein